MHTPNAKVSGRAKNRWNCSDKQRELILKITDEHELDKVKDVKKHLQELINKTKHIVVDRTLFCFLANRDYFDYIHDETTRNSFPVEHTYFSHRLLLCAESEPLYDHLLEVIKLRADGPSPTKRAPTGPLDQHELPPYTDIVQPSG